ncbi:MAG: hypothetical protein A3G39_09655 [Deltaproteobacteria bacterium RIFCSPLOWO2_12_FULL_43_16]|nr:MAG: hypothetical protein A2Z89_06255 [Deltaproteobacteria bacterium GWA2_43_19]OGQ11013.1 MAG: hypothetical protein A3D30_01765 [Deltaproteobacteria bacterium RIFCSPHIGHO2_02_FULL_43_33]OGQ36785.1 MAG: hypothetical protein A3A85_01750 [Deltaproteobacteria bacterium RIFCSPLOWO2_01_FULL_42_9]OGQ60154.1 MAG: hypothetical protein A3G39_09655 [Deltaproteobacteria bacterium RIFCSPLOWO2_12_FULL_43_16]
MTVVPISADDTRKVRIGKLNINEASMQDFSLLPGISEKDAYAIIEYSKKNKGFKKIEEIKLAGISKEKFEEINGLITIIELKSTKKS